MSSASDYHHHHHHNHYHHAQCHNHQVNSRNQQNLELQKFQLLYLHCYHIHINFEGQVFCRMPFKKDFFKYPCIFKYAINKLQHVDLLATTLKNHYACICSYNTVHPINPYSVILPFYVQYSSIITSKRGVCTRMETRHKDILFTSRVCVDHVSCSV